MALLSAATQLQLPIPGESLHFDKAHWVASAITGEALAQARHIAAELAATHSRWAVSRTEATSDR